MNHNQQNNNLLLTAKSYKLKASLGFTLMEIIVSTTIFVVVFSSLLALFNYTLKINRRSEALRQASQGIRNFVEFLVKEIRNGQVDYYVNGGSSYMGQITASSPCKAPGAQGDPVTGADTYVSKENKLGIINREGSRECFYYGKSDGSYVDTVGGSPLTFSAPANTTYTLVMQKIGVSNAQILNPPNLSIDQLMFLVTPTKDPYTSTGGLTKTAPVVGILLKILVKLPTGETVPVYYQTAVATSQYDIPNQ